MPESPRPPESASAPPRRCNWDAVSALIAALIGLLALCVSGYTAYIQREQVRAQVWPVVFSGNNDNENSVEVYNNGVGPAIVQSAQIWVSGKPQPDWMHVLVALGCSIPVSVRRPSIRA